MRTVLATMTINVGEETEEKEGWVETENGWFYYENGQKVTGWKVVSENGTTSMKKELCRPVGCP